MNIFKIIIIIIFLFGPSLKSASQEFGFKEVQLTNSASDNKYASYNKSGTSIIFESNRDGHWQIYMMSSKGENVSRLVNSTYNDRRPTWHPYKNIILFESDRTGIFELYKLELESHKISRINIPVYGNKTRAEYAPNGVQILFNLEDVAGDFDVYLVSHKGKKPKKIIDDKFNNMYPHFSGRGDNILYYSNKNNEGDSDVIYTYNIITKERYRLTYFKNNSSYGKYSNNRRRIVYSALVEGEASEIYIMQNDGRNKKRITFNDEEDIQPSWSPHDINLLISGVRNGNYQICKILLKEPLEEEN
ncbi:TolB family protein [Thalassobellus suaedae]|uniref:Uncharacterized protein n=1 Tax=Thalassobellus suaedae TaxID=3074124 RepID=A0ABY9XNV7_9FLAO|nr:hypothetical protein RHP51_10335 [Flavobacteriaceae bacterium HL-DH14]